MDYINYKVESKQLKSYKGYEIYKAWWSTWEGVRKSDYFYLVSEEGDDDYCGQEYKTLAEAKKAIDSWQ